MGYRRPVETFGTPNYNSELFVKQRKPSSKRHFLAADRIPQGGEVSDSTGDPLASSRGHIHRFGHPYRARGGWRSESHIRRQREVYRGRDIF